REFSGIKNKIKERQDLVSYLNELQQQIQQTQQTQNSLATMLVLFEIDRFKNTGSQSEGEGIECLSNSIKNLLNKHEIVAELEEGTFALVFQGYDPHYVQFFMRDFLKDLHASLSNLSSPSNHIKEPIQIHEALVLLTKNESVSNILKR